MCAIAVCGLIQDGISQVKASLDTWGEEEEEEETLLGNSSQPSH